MLAWWAWVFWSVFRPTWRAVFGVAVGLVFAFFWQVANSGFVLSSIYNGSIFRQAKVQGAQLSHLSVLAQTKHLSFLKLSWALWFGILIWVRLFGRPFWQFRNCDFCQRTGFSETAFKTGRVLLFGAVPGGHFVGSIHNKHLNLTIAFVTLCAGAQTAPNRRGAGRACRLSQRYLDR